MWRNKWNTKKQEKKLCNFHAYKIKMFKNLQKKVRIVTNIQPTKLKMRNCCDKCYRNLCQY